MMNKHNNRINKRRVRNINALRMLAIYDFPEYLRINSLDMLSESKKAMKFKRFFVQWLDYGLSYDYWRHIEKGRNLCTNEFIIHLENKLGLKNGLLDVECENEFIKVLYLYNCRYFVSDFIKRKNLNLNEYEADSLCIYLNTANNEGHILTDELLSNYAELI
ncbi:MAG: hypothetical protein QM504_06635 [Pseudomonadota bacterium]